jgi:uncharacterized membrane protein YdcZ (DUF606 family)
MKRFLKFKGIRSLVIGLFLAEIALVSLVILTIPHSPKLFQEVFSWSLVIGTFGAFFILRGVVGFLRHCVCLVVLEPIVRRFRAWVKYNMEARKIVPPPLPPGLAR